MNKWWVDVWDASAASLERAIGEALSGKVAAHPFDRAVATGEAMSSIGG